MCHGPRWAGSQEVMVLEVEEEREEGNGRAVVSIHVYKNISVQID
jgi:hypothetical protein